MSPSYQRTILYTCKDCEVVQCKWTEGAVSTLHGHGISSCVLMVKEGLFENKFELGFSQESIKIGKGDSVTIPKGAQHEVYCLSPVGETIHIYTPRLESEPSKTNFISKTPKSINSLIDLELKDESISLGQLEKIIEDVRTNSISTSSPFFMNQLFAGVLPQTAMANELITQSRATLATAIGSPVFTEIEKQVILGLSALIGWDLSKAGGIAVPGGSAANFLAMHCARQRFSPSAKKKGTGQYNFKIYVSSEAHYSFLKGAVALGLGQEAIESIEVDQDQKMNPQILEARIRANLNEGTTPLLIVATAGTTVSGAFDPIVPLSKLAKEYSLWLHVDAAWGAPVLFSDIARRLIDGISHADSVTFDAHKFFASNLTSSFFLTKDSQILFEANDVDGGDYLFHEQGEPDRGKMSWQCGRAADAVSFWALWKHLGSRKLGENLERFLEIKNKLCEWIADQPRLRLVYKPSYLNICVEILPQHGGEYDGLWSKYVRNRLIESNKAMVNFSTAKDGTTFLRLILVHPLLTLENVKDILTWALQID